MKLLLISGFLGAGKTTFIRELVRRTGRQIAILENEYAPVGIDGSLLERALPQSDRQRNIWELTEGCICCSMKGDFAASVVPIANPVDPEYLIVEPPGVGRLSSVIAQLQQIEYARIRLLAPVTLVDGKSLGHCLSQYPQIAEDQIAAAHTLVVSKMENAPPEEMEPLRVRLRELNPSGDILTRHYTTMDDAWWNRLQEQGYHGERFPIPQEGEEKRPENYALTGVCLDRPEELICFLEQLIRGRFGAVYRAKGVLMAGPQALRFDVTDGRYEVLLMEQAEDAGKAVFIGENLARQALAAAFRRDEPVLPTPGRPGARRTPPTSSLFARRMPQAK